MNENTLKYVLKNLWHRKMRSWLTILSILIGITAIFTLVSFGWGLQNYVEIIAAEAGTDKLFIQSKGVGAPGTDSNFFLTEEDVNFVKKIKGVSEIEGIYVETAEIEFRDKKKFFFVFGYDPTEFIIETFTADVDIGRNVKKGETTKVALGHNYQKSEVIFERGLSTKNKIRVNGEPFDIVGFYEEVGNPSDDANIYLSKDGFENLFPDRVDEFAFVMVRSNKNTDPQALAERIEDKLRKFKDQDEGKEDFFVQTFEDALATFGAIVGVLNGVLVLIAFISLVVAAVNIMNTMYTSVIERTKEIGIMKSIGAQNKDILMLFVLESGILGFVGGALGVILGWIFASTGGAIAAAAGFGFLQPIFPWYLIVGCIFFAGVIGAGSGFVPAMQAAKMKPVDALRYE